MNKHGRAVFPLLAASALAAYFLMTFWVHSRFVSHRIPFEPLSLALSLALVHGTTVMVLLLISVTTKHLRQARRARSEAVKPAIGDRIADYLAGCGNPDRLREDHIRHRSCFEECLVEMASSIVGDGRSQLCGLAVSLGLVRAWKIESRSLYSSARKQAVSRLGLLGGPDGVTSLVESLSDPDEAIRIESYIGLIRLGEAGALQEAFRRSLTQSLLVKAIVAEELRPHAVSLAQNALPAILADGTAEEVLAALEIIESWQLALPLPEFDDQLAHPCPKIRAAAMKLLPLSLFADSEALAQSVIAGLHDKDADVAAEAAVVAGQLKLEAALTALQQVLLQEQPAAARAAAHALAAISGGAGILQRTLLSAPPATASLAVEAIAKAEAGAPLMAGY